MSKHRRWDPWGEPYDWHNPTPDYEEITEEQAVLDEEVLTEARDVMTRLAHKAHKVKRAPKAPKTSEGWN